MPNSFKALLLTVGLGCHAAAVAPIHPGEPIPADPPEQIESMAVECGGLVTALTAYRACPHLEDEERAELDAWIERAKLDVAAAAKSDAPPGQQHEIASACHRAIHSVRDAHARCTVGPTPKVD